MEGVSSPNWGGVFTPLGGCKNITDARTPHFLTDSPCKLGYVFTAIVAASAGSYNNSVLLAALNVGYYL